MTTPPTDPATPPPPASPTPQKPSSNMPVWLIIAATVLLIIVLGCCGGFVTCSYFAHRNATADSQKLEEHTGSAPANFPADIPYYNGLNVASSAGNSATGIIACATIDSADNVAAFYRSMMPRKGWSLDNDKTFNSKVGLAFSNGQRRASVIIDGLNPRQTTVTFVFSDQ